MAENKRAARPPKIKVIFVCTGNTCRSPMAAYLFRDFLRKKKKLSRFSVSSAGIAAEVGAPTSAHTVTVLAERGIKCVPPHTATQLTLKQAESADMIVCMTASHKRAIGVAEKLVTIGELIGVDVPDPYGQDVDAYRKCADCLAYACAEIYDKALELWTKRHPNCAK